MLIVACTSISFIPFNVPSEDCSVDEICDNAIDDDGDGLVDLNDPDCECEVVEPKSLIPNPSFEETDCCPDMQSQLDCASGWIQASFPTTDFINTCGWFGWENNLDTFPPPQPFPDGQGIVGFRDGVNLPPGGGNPDGFLEPNWKEYAGACLLSPMQADSTYRIEFDVGFVNPKVSPPISVTFFGTTDCKYLPFGGNDIESLVGCPTNSMGWVELGFVDVFGGDGNQWINTAIEVVPTEDILAIAIGPDCFNNIRDNNLYYFLDNLLLDEAKNFQLNFTTISNPCAEDFAIQVEDYPDVTYQWYKDGVALIGETSAQLSQMYGKGSYQVRIDDGTKCNLSGIFQFTIPVLINPIQESICQEDVYLLGGLELNETGLYTDTLTSINNCDSVVILELEVEGTLVDTLAAMIFEGESFEIDNYNFSQPGEYSVIVTSENGCDVLMLIQLDYHKIFIPNVFTPNGDGINDTFSALAKNGLIQQVDLTIFDRWGGTLYKGTEWDGRLDNEFVNPGVYIYLAKITLADNMSHSFSGSVTVLH